MSYIFSCGCELEKEGTILIKRKLTCIQHGGTIKSRKGICKNDGKIFYRGARGQLGFLCDDCAAEEKLKTSRKRQAKRKAARIERLKAEGRLPDVKREPKITDCVDRGDYCKGALLCSEYPACMDCDKFYPIWENVDPGRMEQWTL